MKYPLRIDSEGGACGCALPPHRPFPLGAFGGPHVSTYHQGSLFPLFLGVFQLLPQVSRARELRREWESTERGKGGRIEGWEISGKEKEIAQVVTFQAPREAPLTPPPPTKPWVPGWNVPPPWVCRWSPQAGPAAPFTRQRALFPAPQGRPGKSRTDTLLCSSSAQRTPLLSACHVALVKDRQKEASDTKLSHVT